MPNIWQYCKRTADRIEQTSVIVGQISSYLVILSIILITISVVLRYFFSQTYVALDEMQYYCYSIIFLFAFSYVYKEDGHIKVDIFYQKLPEKKKNIVKLLGTLFLTIPWTGAICYFSFKYFLRSYEVSERSTQPTGLPALYILKFILFLAFVLMLMQAVAKAIQLFNEFHFERES